MKNPIGRLVAVGLVAAMTLAVTVGAASAWPPKGSFIIGGKLEHTMLLSTEEIADYLATTNPQVYTVTFQAGTAVETHTFTGFLLYDVLTFLGPRFDPAVRNDKLRFYACGDRVRWIPGDCGVGRIRSHLRKQACPARVHAGWEITCRGRATTRGPR